MALPTEVGSSSGMMKYQMNSCTRMGMLRNNSTQALARRTTQGRSGSVRRVPMTDPNRIATTQAQAATARVQRHASIIHCR